MFCWLDCRNYKSKSYGVQFGLAFRLYGQRCGLGGYSFRSWRNCRVSRGSLLHTISAPRIVHRILQLEANYATFEAK